MITEIVGDLLNSDKCHVIVHQCNLFHVMGGGIAKHIKQKFPEAYEADKKTNHGDRSKLGTYSVARVRYDGLPLKYIVNLYSQADFGGSHRQTSYDAMVEGLTLLRESLEKHHAKGNNLVLGIPYQLGCGLAHGNWSIVRAIIDEVFFSSPVEVYIYKLPGL